MTLTPVEFDPGELWHVRLLPGDAKRSPKNLTLEPRRTRSAMWGEDTKVLRVSLGPSPGEALAATHEWSLPYQDPRAIHFYANTVPVIGMAPSTELVPDAEESNEVWCRRPIPMVKVGVVLPGRSRELLLGGYEVANALNIDYGLTHVEATQEVAEYFNEMLEEWKGWQPHYPFAGVEVEVKVDPYVPRMKCNPDTRRRQLERAAATGDVQAEAELLRDKLRSDELTPTQVCLAAALRYPPAVLLARDVCSPSLARQAEHEDAPAPGLSAKLVESLANRSTYLAIRYANRVTLGCAEIVRESLPPSVVGVVAASREFVSSEGNSDLGRGIVDEYLDLIPVRGPMYTGTSDSEFQTEDALEVARQLVLAVGISSGAPGIGWGYGWQWDRMHQAVRYTLRYLERGVFRGLNETYVSMNDEYDRFLETIRAEVVPWLLGHRIEVRQNPPTVPHRGDLVSVTWEDGEERIAEVRSVEGSPRTGPSVYLLFSDAQEAMFDLGEDGYWYEWNESDVPVSLKILERGT